MARLSPPCQVAPEIVAQHEKNDEELNLQSTRDIKFIPFSTRGFLLWESLKGFPDKEQTKEIDRHHQRRKRSEFIWESRAGGEENGTN